MQMKFSDRITSLVRELVLVPPTGGKLHSHDAGMELFPQT